MKDSAANQSQGFHRAAMAAAAVMMSYQTAGKAARDALFLSNYPVSKLPAMVIGAALVSILLGLLFGRFMERHGPARVVPRVYLLSGVLQVFEWILMRIDPVAFAPLAYLHIVGLGAILLSGFWSITSERLNPREAKKLFGQIASMGTVGGILGGLVAERMGAFFGTRSVLLQLAAAHIACGIILLRATRGQQQREEPPEDPVSPWDAFSRIPYLGSLAVLVLLGTSSAAAIDFLFKAQAAEMIGRGAPLLRFFAIFHTTSAVITFLLQAFVSRISFERLGLTRTVGSLPAAVGVGSLASLAFPFFPITSITRLLELVIRGSVFRSGYELFYTPIPVKEKRSVKSLIDVACDRLGDAVGSAIVQTALVTAPAAVRNVILGIVVISSGISLWIASRLDKGYHEVVKRGLMERADQLDLGYMEDITSLSAVLNTVSLANIPRIPLAAALPPSETPQTPAPPPAAIAGDESIELLADLRSNDLDRVMGALSRMQNAADPVLLPQLIRLLAWDEVASGVRKILQKDAVRHAGMLVDYLLDEKQDFAIRRRIPRILASTKTQRAADGLMEGLGDTRFEVRFQCSRALDYLRQHAGNVYIDPQRIYLAVERELSVNRTIWDGRRLLDQRDSSDEFSYLDELIKERAHQSLEHVFSLLSVVLPREPLKVAFRALHFGDAALHGLALEYLEGVLPDQIRTRLWSVLEGGVQTPPPEKAREQAMKQLMQSYATQLTDFKREARKA